MLQVKHIIATFCLVLFLSTNSFAQDREEFEAIESEKIAYITKELKLTPSEAQRFFPIYNKYNDEMWNIKRAKRGTAPVGAQSLTGGSRTTKRDVIEYDAKELDIKKKYRAQFSQVVGQARASQFFQVVEDFNNMLRKELLNRRNNSRR